MKNSIFNLKLAFAIAVLLAFSKSSLASDADDFKAASKAVCEKMKQCALAQMDMSDMTPEMRQMSNSMVSNMCIGVLEFSQIEPYQALYEPAAACLQSMSILSCNELIESGDVVTPACTEYEKLAQSYQNGG